MSRVLDWFETATPDPVLKAGVAHLWFVTIHPFDDGNGRIARAIADLARARAEETAQRFYSMSAQIRIERKAYYDMLESTQKSDLDITPWRSEEHTSALQSLMRISYAVFCLKNNIDNTQYTTTICCNVTEYKST